MSAGVPHFVVPVPDLTRVVIAELGPALRRHPHFGSGGANVDFVARLADGSLGIRTWERGVEGETLACGSGAVAAAYAAWRDGAGPEVGLTPWSGIPLRVCFAGSVDASTNPIERRRLRMVSGRAGAS